ncbi:MAG: hypothetical protein WD066_00975 [Planctomycetaceae bacterium]
MSEQAEPMPPRAATWRWKVVAATTDELESQLNALSREWEIFAVLPELAFGAKMMGTPVPSGVQYRIVLRRRDGSVGD